MSSDSVIDRIDLGLKTYYEKLGRKDYVKADGVGKFKFFVEESGFEDDGIEDELKQEPDECTIVEFDMDEDDNNNFPLEEEIEDEDAKNKEIHRILNDIAKYGAPREALETMELNVDICADLEEVQLNKFTADYISQMSSLQNLQGKDGDLKWYLAVSSKQKYPFLTYMVDSFTKEKAEHHFKTCKDDNSTPLTVAVWTQKNKFFIALRRKYPQKANQLQSAMINYSNRIMNRLQFQPTYKIDDNILQIVEYIVSVPKFVKNTLLNQAAIPPFQVDLLIAVNKVIAQFGGGNDDDQDDDEEDDEKNESMDPNIDHIGFVQNEFKNLKPHPIYYAPPNDKYEINGDQKDENERMDALSRIIGDRYNDFRTILSGGGDNENNSGKIYGGKKSKYFESKSYPSRRRFSIFVDRRNKKPTGGNLDEMTMFEPPNSCNKMDKDHVPEIGFEFLRSCILPKSNGKHVTATDGLCGQLITFMFNVEAINEIKCYIVWNGQTMRFHGDHIGKILPNIFVENDENKNFANSQEAKGLEREFETIMDDRKFAKFYLALRNFE